MPLKSIRLKDPSQRLYTRDTLLQKCAALLKSERVRLKIAKFGSIQCQNRRICEPLKPASRGNSGF